jgi:hypothetical protein
MESRVPGKAIVIAGYSYQQKYYTNARREQERNVVIFLSLHPLSLAAVPHWNSNQDPEGQREPREYNCTGQLPRYKARQGRKKMDPRPAWWCMGECCITNNNWHIWLFPCPQPYILSARLRDAFYKSETPFHHSTI